MYLNFKNRIFINKLCFLLPFLAYKNFYFTTYICTFIFALLHELAHFLAAVLCGEKEGSIYINPYGFELKIFTADFKNEFAVIICGPLLNFILWAFFLVMKEYSFAKINFTIGTLNLIPALPLDGGRILKIILRKKCSAFKSTVIMKRAGLFIVLFLTFISLIYFNIWLLVIASLILIRNNSTYL